MNRIGWRYLFLVVTLVSLGVWGIAVTVPHQFDAGETISSSDVNANFTALAEAVSALEEGITAGGAVVGRSDDDGTPDLVAAGNDLSDAGDNGILSSDPDLPASDLILQSNDNLTIRINANDDADPATLSVENGAGATVLEVDEAGDVAIVGTLRASGGVGLPLAYGSVDATGFLLSGAGPIDSVELDGSTFRIALAGISYSSSTFVATVTPSGTFGSVVAPSVRTGSSGGELAILFYDNAGSLVTGPFHFVIFGF